MVTSQWYQSDSNENGWRIPHQPFFRRRCVFFRCCYSEQLGPIILTDSTLSFGELELALELELE
jgi:hypothetical protein